MLDTYNILGEYINEHPEHKDGRKMKFVKTVCSNINKYISIIDMQKNGKSSRDIGLFFNEDPKNIWTILDKFKIDMSRRVIQKEDANKFVIDREKGLTLEDLSKKYNFAASCIKESLNKSGINTNVRLLQLTDKDLIEEMYSNMQSSEIAKIKGVSAATINRFLEANGIKRRTLSESASLNIKKKGVNFKGVNIPFQSRKNSKWFLANSGYEVARFIELERDENVISYSKEVERIPYNSGNNTYTPDILVRYTDRVEIEEVKPRWYMQKMQEVYEASEIGNLAVCNRLSLKSINKFKLAKIKFEEALLYYESLGIKFTIKTEDDIDVSLSEYSCLTKLSEKERRKLNKQKRNELLHI